MPTYEQILEQTKNLDGISKFLGKKEIKELPKVLWEDEVLERIIQGWYVKGNGILVATNKRLIFLDKGLIAGLRVEDFPYDKISSIQYETGFLTGTLTIFTSGNKAVIEQVDKQQCRDFGDYVRARITKATTNHAVQTPVAVPQSDGGEVRNGIVDQLERLAKLKDQGILTEEEFTQQKYKILNS